MVDEIHAVADDKRGSHLALSLERPRQSNGQGSHAYWSFRHAKPIELVAHFLSGSARPDPVIVQIGHRRELDLAIEVPGSELGPVAFQRNVGRNLRPSGRARGAASLNAHFCKHAATRERVAHHLGERLGQDAVATHHGSLFGKLRLTAERKLKAGEIRALVATASLELGIDIGSVDLVCQIGSPRSISVGFATYRPRRPLAGCYTEGPPLCDNARRPGRMRISRPRIRQGDSTPRHSRLRLWIFWAADRRYVCR